MSRAPSLRDTTFTVVPHTHWDREWYLPFAVFRALLVRTVDEIVDVLERDPEFRHFTLDGQAVILEDYLEIRPEREGRLRALIAAGRLSIGPSYVLPDEFLAGQEALVRNLLMGAAACRRLGGRPMEVGYMPDPFGHIAQLPQIRGFGLDLLVFWRGLGPEADELGAFFWWCGPDGSRVLAVRQLGGYGNANQLGRWTEEWVSGVHDRPEMWAATAAERFPRFLREFGDVLGRSRVPEALLCNGSDHQPIQADLPVLLARAREAHPGLDVRIAAYQEFLARVRPRVGDAPTVRGELRMSREAPILRGINSTRMYLKQAAEATERALLVAETLATLGSLRGAMAYPTWEMRLGWRELLRNLPHDSISGCSVDEVHRDMAARFATAAQLAERVRRQSLAALAGRAAPWSHDREAGAAVSVVNPLPWRRLASVQIAVPAELQGARHLRVETVDGPLAAQLGGARGARWARVVAPVGGFRSLGLRLAPGAGALPAGVMPATASGASPTVENEFYRVTLLPSGQASVVDLRTGRVHAALHRLEDVADRGDEYTFDPLPDDVGWSSEEVSGTVRVVERGPVRATVEASFVARLPQGLAPDRRHRARRPATCPVRVRVSVTAGVDRIEFQTVVENRARDHRLRVAFPSPDAGEHVRAEGHFAVIERPAVTGASRPDWPEDPPFTQHTAGFVAAGSVAVFGCGLREYEAVPRPGGGLDIALTLLRCVGWLSRSDLSTRRGHAGPELATPEAQCPGTHTFEYALSLRGAAPDLELVRASADYRFGFELGPAGVELGEVLTTEGDPDRLRCAQGRRGRGWRHPAARQPRRGERRTVGHGGGNRGDRPLPPGRVTGPGTGCQPAGRGWNRTWRHPVRRRPRQ